MLISNVSFHHNIFHYKQMLTKTLIALIKSIFLGIQYFLAHLPFIMFPVLLHKLVGWMVMVVSNRSGDLVEQASVTLVICLACQICKPHSIIVRFLTM